jgi:(p)ppGpp synthase/HD superfamily hydrolase
MQLFGSRFQSSGKHFLSHLVGTASILVALQQPIDIVAAGLLHTAYINGDFGTEPCGMTLEKRERVRGVVGDFTEDLIVHYTQLKWDSDTIPAIAARIDRLYSRERQVLLIRLANELENLLDLGILYCGNADQRRKQIGSSLYLFVKMSHRLGFPSLAQAFSRVFREVISSEIPSPPGTSVPGS